MANVLSKTELDNLNKQQLISYLEGIDEGLFNGYIDADTKVRYFLLKYGEGILRAIKGTYLFFPAVTAQSILESGYGRNIPKDSYNFGGIKYAPNLQGVIGYVLADTTEYNSQGIKVPVHNVKFSKFADVESGFKAHVGVLMDSRYQDARLNATSPEEQITMIAKAGYTTTSPSTYLNSMKGNINRIRNKTKIARVS